MNIKDFIAQFSDPYYENFEIQLNTYDERIFINGFDAGHCRPRESMKLEVTDIGYSERVIRLSIAKT